MGAKVIENTPQSTKFCSEWVKLAVLKQVYLSTVNHFHYLIFFYGGLDMYIIPSFLFTFSLHFSFARLVAAARGQKKMFPPKWGFSLPA